MQKGHQTNYPNLSLYVDHLKIIRDNMKLPLGHINPQIDRQQKKALELSEFSEYDGVTILSIAELALTDANFHKEALILKRMATLISEYDYDFELIWGDHIDILDKALEER